MRLFQVSVKVTDTTLRICEMIIRFAKSNFAEFNMSRMTDLFYFFKNTSSSLKERDMESNRTKHFMVFVRDSILRLRTIHSVLLTVSYPTCDLVRE